MPTTDTPDPTKGDPKPDPKPSGDDVVALKKALDDERRIRRDAEKVVESLNVKIKELGDRDKSETEKLADRVAAAEKRADEADARVTRAEVAFAKSLTPAQAEFLTGGSREEIEAQADRLLTAFPRGATDDSKSTQTPTQTPTRPTEHVRGGGDPTSAPPLDIRKVIADIPR